MGYIINNETKKIILTRGDTFRMYAEPLEWDGTPYTPVSGDTIRFVMKRSYRLSDVVLEKAIPIDTLLLELDPVDTQCLPFGSYDYDIELTFANGDVDTFIQGEFVIGKEVD